jgi:hypothetical protein
LRLGVCDLFIHGLGGGRYDPVTEAWFAAWLPGAAPLAPVAVVSATLTLPLDERVPDPGEIARARWLAHRARHDPAAIGDRAAAAAKAAAIHAVRHARGRTARLAAYRDLQSLLAEYRRHRAEALADLDRRAADAAAVSRRSAVVHERTWPCPLYPPGALAALRDRIDAAMPPPSGR